MWTSPVFLCEAITASRRWQEYALRAFLVLALLIVLVVVWIGRRQGAPTNVTETRQFLAELGENFYYGCAGIQLALALLAAPAATAGAVCVDRARGWLAHMFVTDLSDTEIVVGKLMARLASVVVVVFASLPVLAIVGLLGGMIPEALVNLTMVTLALLLLGCSLALALSVRASRTHDALMVVLAVWTFWLLSAPLWGSATRAGVVRNQPDWFYKLNPFVLAYCPYTKPGYVHAGDVVTFVATACLLSGAALFFTIRHLRIELSPNRGFSRVRKWLGWMKANLFSWWPSPSLDANPVLWREWHRNRPSGMARWVSGLFVAGTTLGMGVGIAGAVTNGPGVGNSLLEGVGLWAVTFGLLILSARAPTALTEERVRGSLDILLTTPLPTHVIVLSKWWAIYRGALPLMVIPALTGLFVAAACLDRPLWLTPQLLGNFPPITTTDRVIAGLFPAVFLLAHAAVTTSVGLALATWFQRTGRAVAASVAVYVVASIGSVIAMEAALRPFLNWWSTNVSEIPHQTTNALQRAIIAISPLGGQAASLDVLEYGWDLERALVWRILLWELISIFAAAAFFLGLTLLIFNRCLGRMNDSPELARTLRGRQRSRRLAGPVVPTAEAS